MKLNQQRLGNATIGLGWILVFLVSYTIAWLTAGARYSRFPSIPHPSKLWWIEANLVYSFPRPSG